MTFLEHLEELRVRLIRSIVALLLAFGVCWNFSQPIFHFLTQPLRQAYPDIKFMYTAPTEAFMLYMKMDSFIAPGLYSHEKAYAVPFIAFGTLFFVAGAAFGHYVLFPMTFQFLGGFASADMEFKPRI